MLDYDAPENQEKKERCKRWGRKFSETLRLDKGASKIQEFALKKPKCFFSIIGLLMLTVIGLNVRNGYLMYKYSEASKADTYNLIEQKKQELIKRRTEQKNDTTQVQTINIEEDYESEID